MSDWSIRRLSRVQEVTGAQRYLEVGVYHASTFHAVPFPEKDAVDVYFPFDTQAYASAEVRFHQMTSDAFFVSGQAREPYDVIYLDGLHTFEQTFRDFVATLSLAHADTVWLIDDTMPSDVYSAIADPELSIAERHRAGLPGDLWHGDVYKVVLAIHDFCPNVNFATIVDNGNPQTLVWREPRADFRPAFSGLEAISRVSYFDRQRCADAFHYCTEQEALDRWQHWYAKRCDEAVEVFV